MSQIRLAPMDRVNVAAAVATPLVAGFLFMHWFPGGGAPSVDFVRGVGIWMTIQGLGMGAAFSLRLIGPLARTPISGHCAGV
jgi:hypothetical protein